MVLSVFGKGKNLTTEIREKATNAEKSSFVGNPFSKSKSFDNSIIARMNSLNGGIVKPKTTKPVLQNQNFTVSYPAFLNALNKVFTVNMASKEEVFSSIGNLLSNVLGSSFSAIGSYNKENGYINLKLLDKSKSAYTTRVFLSEEKNPIAECYTKNMPIFAENPSFLKIQRLENVPVAILPLHAHNEFNGVLVVGDNNCKKNFNFHTLVSNCVGLFLNNFDLHEKVSAGLNIDGLTQLHNHRGFQEKLSFELKRAEENHTELSVVMMDINNISKVNRELGHAKGDEIIKLVADKIKTNISSADTAGRYGGDEIAIILPNTSTKEAKYLAEYLTYTLSCCFVDGVGPVRLSVGIATYPHVSTNQEKLLIMAEHAMYISQSKGYKDGMSAIVSSDDINFWDNKAINSFAEVLAKRHSQIGVNFEEELVNKFNSEEISSQNHLMEMVTSLAGAIDAKDPYTKGHSTSVSRYSEALARALHLPEAEVKKITLGALLHDVGKIGIPENVLKKPTHLSDEEWEIMKQHPSIGAEKVLMPNEALRELIPIVKYHHERWDGKGYPEGLKETQIPYAARIVSIADAYHALISDRPYRKGMSVEKACEILKMGAGIQWDADLVRQFIQIAPSISTII